MENNFHRDKHVFNKRNIQYDLHAESIDRNVNDQYKKINVRFEKIADVRAATTKSIGSCSLS